MFQKEEPPGAVAGGKRCARLTLKAGCTAVDSDKPVLASLICSTGRQDKQSPERENTHFTRKRGDFEEVALFIK